MWCLATLLPVVLFIAFIASTRRINKDKVRSIFGESDTKHEEAATNGEGQGEGGGVSMTTPEYVTEGGSEINKFEINKFDRVKVIENVDGKASDRWGLDGDSSFPLVREDVGTVNLFYSNGVVGVIFDKDVELEVRVNHTYLVKDDPPLHMSWQNGYIIERLLNNFPRREDMAAFKCPITREIFRVPVVAADGRTYEESALIEASNGAEPYLANNRINSLLKDLAGKVVVHIPAQTLDTTYEEIEQWKIQILNENPPALGAENAWSFKRPFSLGDENAWPPNSDVLQDPVVASDGHTYERELITQVLQGNALSPMTHEPLAPDLFPNRALKLLLSVLIHKAREEALIAMMNEPWRGTNE